MQHGETPEQTRMNHSSTLNSGREPACQPRSIREGDLLRKIPPTEDQAFSTRITRSALRPRAAAPPWPVRSR